MRCMSFYILTISLIHNVGDENNTQWLSINYLQISVDLLSILIFILSWDIS